MYQSVEHRGGGAVSAATKRPLPCLTRELLVEILGKLSEEERTAAFTMGIVPVAKFGRESLCALVDGKAAQSGMRVACRISAADFKAAMEQVFGWTLAENAAQGLRIRNPMFSADVRLSSGQALWLGAISSVLLLLFWDFTLTSALHAVALVLTPFYDGMVLLRLSALIAGKAPAAGKTRFAPLSDEALPLYSVLVPMFRETAVLPQLLTALAAIDYPPNKLDVKLILEETDTAMQQAIAQHRLPRFFEVIIVPDGKPRTKPRALNYALNFARGELLTIFDAEDIPEPLQLRKAAAAFARAPWKMACLQAELAFFNAQENWLTQQFAIEYATLFRLLLPQLSQLKLPLPLGGTSNHFRTAILREIGGWDSHNVTEDADLGFRLARFGCETGVLPSITYEEANTEVRNWLHQRARWLKGFLQTWFVHMRNPGDLVAETGLAGFLSLQATVIGVVLTSAFYPLFLALVVHDVLANPELGPLTLAFLAQFAIGTSVMIVSSFWALRQKNLLAGTLLLTPVYWGLASVAAWLAIWQLLVNPFHWNKTSHGLSAFLRRAGTTS